MPMALSRAPLSIYLKQKDEALYAKAIELRQSVTGWLAYIPATFPHYTRHTVEHSEEIVSQISKILFSEDDPQRPTVAISAIEAYILIAAALLHDAGMVCSESEKTEILKSHDWKEWINYGSAARRWADRPL